MLCGFMTILPVAKSWSVWSGSPTKNTLEICNWNKQVWLAQSPDVQEQHHRSLWPYTAPDALPTGWLGVEALLHLCSLHAFRPPSVCGHLHLSPAEPWTEQFLQSLWAIESKAIRSVEQPGQFITILNIFVIVHNILLSLIVVVTHDSCPTLCDWEQKTGTYITSKYREDSSIL